MSYATQQDLVDHYGEAEIIQLSDRADTGAINAAVVAEALTDASEEMDGYIGTRYALPLPTQPTALTRICADIARYRLYQFPPDEVAQRYKDAVKFLENISKGSVTLGLPQAEQPESAGEPQSSKPSRVFTRTSLTDFQSYDFGNGGKR